jgi:hypothetical protein
MVMRTMGAKIRVKTAAAKVAEELKTTRCEGPPRSPHYLETFRRGRRIYWLGLRMTK